MKRRTLLQAGVAACSGLLGFLPQKRERPEDHFNVVRFGGDDHQDITKQLEWCLRRVSMIEPVFNDAYKGFLESWHPCGCGIGLIVRPEDKGEWRPRAFVTIKPGTYRLSHSIVIPGNVTLYGGHDNEGHGVLLQTAHDAFLVEKGGSVYAVHVHVLPTYPNPDSPKLIDVIDCDYELSRLRRKSILTRLMEEDAHG